MSNDTLTAIGVIAQCVAILGIIGIMALVYCEYFGGYNTKL